MRDRAVFTCAECNGRTDITFEEDTTMWECLNCEMVQEIPRYTLLQAERILKRRKCDRDGHDLDCVIVHSAEGSVVSHMIRCERCVATFSEDPPVPSRNGE